MYMLIKRIVIYSALLLSACTSRPDFKQPPEFSYDYYSGAAKFGNHYCKVQSFTHIDSGKKITLIGMIHTADDSYYKKIDNILDEYDVILEEGIHGLPSFGVHKYFSKYVFYTMKRFTYLQGLSSQGHTLKDRDNAVPADMSSDQFASEGSIFTPVIQLISLPVMMLFTEPYYLYENSKIKALSLFSDQAEINSRAEIRHMTLNNMDLSDKPSKTFLPGIISSRNSILLKELEKQINKPEINSIAIPWGASHLPSLHRDLLKNGYRLDGNHQWLRSIAVSDYKENKEDFSNHSEYFGIPYIIESEITPKTASTSLILSSVSITSSEDYSRFSLLYGDLIDSISTDKAHFFSILPKVFGKPLLFDYLRSADKSRIRFLWFFQFGELK